MAGGCWSAPDHLPRLHKGIFIPRAGGGGERPASRVCPSASFWETTSPVMGTGHAGPTPVGSAPGAHVGAISPAGILVDTSRFFLDSRAVAQRGGEGGGVMSRLRLLPGKGRIPES